MTQATLPLPLHAIYANSNTPTAEQQTMLFIADCVHTVVGALFATTLTLAAISLTLISIAPLVTLSALSFLVMTIASAILDINHTPTIQRVPVPQLYQLLKNSVHFNNPLFIHSKLKDESPWVTAIETALLGRDPETDTLSDPTVEDFQTLTLLVNDQDTLVLNKLLPLCQRALSHSFDAPLFYAIEKTQKREILLEAYCQSSFPSLSFYASLMQLNAAFDIKPPIPTFPLPYEYITLVRDTILKRDHLLLKQLLVDIFNLDTITPHQHCELAHAFIQLGDERHKDLGGALLELDNAPSGQAAEVSSSTAHFEQLIRIITIIKANKNPSACFKNTDLRLTSFTNFESLFIEKKDDPLKEISGIPALRNFHIQKGMVESYAWENKFTDIDGIIDMFIAIYNSDTKTTFNVEELLINAMRKKDASELANYIYKNIVPLFLYYNQNSKDNLKKILILFNNEIATRGDISDSVAISMAALHSVLNKLLQS